MFREILHPTTSTHYQIYTFRPDLRFFLTDVASTLGWREDYLHDGTSYNYSYKARYTTCFYLLNDHKSDSQYSFSSFRENTTPLFFTAEI